MKKTYFIATAIFAAVSLSGCVTTEATQAETGSKSYSGTANKKDSQGENTKNHTVKKKKHRRSGGGHSKAAFFTTYDLNEDGRVTEQEFYASRDNGYDARDADNNGGVAPDEYVAEYEGRLDEQLAEQRDRQLKQAYVRFDVLDGDKNGVITREEFRNSGKRMFDRLDTNKDGVVDENDTAERY